MPYTKCGLLIDFIVADFDNMAAYTLSTGIEIQRQKAKQKSFE